ncbi:MAG: AbrB family transcriptional regulator [Chloroflexota bacterium]
MSHTLFVGAIFGIVGGLLARYYNMPGGAFIGSMFGTALYSATLDGGIVIPSNLRIGIQIAAGILIGTTVKKELFQGDFYVFLWAIVGAVTFLGVGLFFAFIAVRLGHLDMATALFGFAPGGLTGMSVASQEEGAEAAQVVLMHVSRVFLLFFTVPFLVRWLLSRME